MTEKKLERKVYDTYYEASDGTEFRTKEECEKYEQTAHAVVRTKFLKLVTETKTEYDFFGVGCDENTVHAVRVESSEDVNTILHLYYLDNPYVLNDDENAKKYKERVLNLVNTAYQEQDILFVGENYDGEIYIINTKANIIEDLQKVGSTKEED